MAIKSVQAIVNGVTTTLTYDSKSKTYKGYAYSSGKVLIQSVRTLLRSTDHRQG